MIKIMKSVLAIVGVIALASCSSAEEIFNENVGGKSVKMTFTASQENGSATRTAIGTEDGKTKIWWSEGDKITVTNGTNTSDFTLQDGVGTTKATFGGELPVSEGYYAIYPSQTVKFSGNKFTGVQLKAEQEAVEGSFDKEAAIMVAKSNGTNLPFKNVIAYFKVTPAFNCSEIVVKANKSEEVLAGKFDVTIAEDGTPTIEKLTEGSNTVKLKGTITAGKTYYIVFLPSTLSEGFTVTLKSTDNSRYYRQRTTGYTVNRNDLCNLGELSTSNMTKEPPYITFTASTVQGLTLFNNSTLQADGLQYSLNGGEWTNYAVSTTVTFGGTNGDLRLRAKNANGIYCEYAKWDNKSGKYCYVFSFDNDTPVECSGDIRTLIDYDNYESTNTSTARFSKLFAGLTALKSAPELPSTTLAEGCYEYMFYNCTSLTAAPNLPATKLATNCYSAMFYNCTSLTAAPELPATTLADYCYDSMFKNCTSLTIAPSISATTLAKTCCTNMFEGCKNMNTAPELKATTLADYCYDSMFKNCTSLTIAPELRATTLADGCYRNMFNGCTGLTQAPELRATTLADGCYRNMFNGCTGLTQAPELPATTLANECYYGMFSDCTGLTQAPELRATTLAKDCYAYMFNGCTGLTQAPDLPATKLSDGCYLGMFKDCTRLTQAPNLPATTLAQSCYYYMFNGCKKLSNVKMLATDVTANSCLTNWLKGAGTDAGTRTLTLANQGVYDALVDKGFDWFPKIWQSGNATISYQSE